jgi:drug/metabolite transporter (DMT)-like permease
MQAVLLLSFGAICISFAAIFVKLLGDTVGPTAIGFWRTLFGSGFLFVIGFGRGNSLRISRGAIVFAALAGFVFFMDLFLWHRSILLCGAGLATILANTQVFGTAVLSFFLFKERLGLKFILAAVSAMVGVVLLVGLATDQVQFSGGYLRGIVYGLGTGVVYAHYIVILKKAGQTERLPDFVVFVAWVSLFSALFLGIAASFEPQPFWPPSLATFAILLALALVAQAIGWWSIFTSLKQVEASRAGLILLLQPTLATVWGVLFFDEHLAPTQIVGATITLAAIYVGSLRVSARPAAAEPEPLSFS